MDKVIIRSYPSKKSTYEYPNRHKAEIFKIYKVSPQIDAQFLIKYEKLKSGINYETNRKIKINGPTYSRLQFELDERRKITDSIRNLNADEYELETKKIYSEIDEKNRVIREYNCTIDTIIENINKLIKWDDYVEFEGNCYGISPFYNNIHRVKDCMGVIKTIFESCTCNCCENWFGCNNPKDNYYYHCEKCKNTYSR
jgi:hypothetical protein